MTDPAVTREGTVLVMSLPAGETVHEYQIDASGAMRLGTMLIALAIDAASAILAQQMTAADDTRAEIRRTLQ